MPAPIAMLRTKSLPNCAIGSAIECDTYFGIDPFLGLPLTAIVMFCLGYAVQRGLLNLIVAVQFQVPPSSAMTVLFEVA